MLKIRSPAASFVEKLLVDEGAIISIGTPVLQMDSSDERHEIERIKKFRQLVVLGQERMKEADIAKKKRILELSTMVAKRYVEYLEHALQATKERQSVGEVGALDTDQVEDDLIEGRAKLEKARIMTKLYIDTVSQNKKIAEMSLQHSDLERAFAESKVRETKIVSPFDGIIRFKVGPGSYVKTGGVVAVVERKS